MSEEDVSIEKENTLIHSFIHSFTPITYTHKYYYNYHPDTQRTHTQ